MPEPVPQNDVTQVEPRDGSAMPTLGHQRFPDALARRRTPER